MSRPNDDLSKVLFTRVTPKLKAEAKREAKRLGISIAELSRRALEKYLTQQAG